MATDQAVDIACKHDAPADLPGPVSNFIKVTQQLTNLILREMDLLRDKRPKEVQALHGEKTRLTAEYRKMLGILRINERQLLGEATSKARSYVKQVTELFRQALADHARMITRMRDVCQGVVNAIGEEVNRQRRPVTPYGRDARLQYAGRSAPTQSLAVDASI